MICTWAKRILAGYVPGEKTFQVTSLARFGLTLWPHIFSGAGMAKRASPFFNTKLVLWAKWARSIF